MNDDVVTKYNEIKLGHKYKYIIMELSADNTEIVVTKTAEPTATFSEFTNELPKDGCRYAIFDFDFELKDGGKRNKLIFFVWAPDEAKIRQKMLVSTAKKLEKIQKFYHSKFLM